VRFREKVQEMLHEELKESLASLKRKCLELEKILAIDDKKKQLSEIEASAADPKLWENQDLARKLMQEKSLLEKMVRQWETLRDQLDEQTLLLEMASESELGELALEVKKLQALAGELEIAMLFSGEYDQNDAILSINAGAGGTDAQDWGQILLRMYTRWAEKKGFTVQLPDISYGEEAGIKSATLLISGPNAYGHLRNEAGVHRLVRISPFSSEGKRHTSFVAVEVTPELTEDIKIEINPGDLRVDTYRASGPGGQNVNKVSSAIRITHLPTGIVTQSQSDRSQHNNRDTAMRMLKAKLHEMMVLQRKEKIDELVGEKRKIEWGSQIRSYVFQPYTLVKDNRTGVEVGDVESVIDGEIDPFIEGSLRAKIQ